jgi:hypothetical protein
MSYSFTVKASTKSEAKSAVAAKMAEVAEQQSAHARDRDQAVAAASAFIDQLADDESKDVAVSLSGYLSWTGAQGGDMRVTGATVSVGAHLVDR